MVRPMRRAGVANLVGCSGRRPSRVQACGGQFVADVDDGAPVEFDDRLLGQEPAAQLPVPGLSYLRGILVPCVLILIPRKRTATPSTEC